MVFQRTFLISVGAIFLLAVGASRAAACDDGHWIQAVLADGKLLELEDGSVWQVDATDRVTASLWLPPSDVIVCDDKIVNVDESEAVEVRRLR